MRKKDHGKSEDDDRLWETVTSQINPLKSVRYSGVMEKGPATRKNSPLRKITGRTETSATGKSLSSPAKATPIDLREGQPRRSRQDNKTKTFQRQSAGRGET